MSVRGGFPSWIRSVGRRLALVLGAVLLLTWWSWPRPGPTAADDGDRFGPRWSFPLLDWDFEPAPIDFCVALQDPDGEPVPQMQVSMLGQARPTDDGGIACFEDIPVGKQKITVPEGWHASDVWVREPWGTSTVYALCRGEIAVSFEDDAPAAGATLRVRSFPRGDEQSLTLDDHGVADVTLRPCGRVLVQVIDDNLWYPEEVITITGRERSELTLPHENAAILEVVDPAGQPIVELALAGADAEELAPGVFAITAPGRSAWIALSAAGFDRTRLLLPLDEGTHRVAMEPLREVVVTVVGEPPSRLECGENSTMRAEPCVGSGALWTCGCPPDDAALFLPSQGDPSSLVRSESIPDGATSYTLDRDAAPGTLVARWTGPQPCSAEMVFHRGEGSCDRDGRIEVTGLQPGPGSLVVYSTQARAEVPFRVEAGGVVDLGDIPPDDGVIFGNIYADFPLENAYLVTYPGRAELDADGSFVVTDVPRDADVRLSLRVPGWGFFPRIARGGETVEWDLRWQENQTGLDPPEIVDTG